MNGIAWTDRPDKLPGISTLDLDSTLHRPPARDQPHQDISTAYSTADFFKNPKPGPGSALPLPREFPTSDSYLDPQNTFLPSGGERPEQPNASALEAAKDDVDYLSFDWSELDPDAYRGPGNYLVGLEPPVTTSTMKNEESKQLETGSYDTTRSTYFYSDTSHLETRRRAQTPTTRRPEPPLSPTTMTAAPQQLHTSASKDIQELATGSAQTPHEAQENHYNVMPLETALPSARFQWEGIEWKRIEAKKKAELDMNDNLPPPWAPQSQDTIPRADTPPLPSAAQPASWPSEDNLSLDLSPQPPFFVLRSNQKQTEHSKQRPPVPASGRQPKRSNPYLKHFTLPPSPANGSEITNPNPNNSPDNKKNEPKTEKTTISKPRPPPP
jgi:hypothetical protein